MIPEVACSQTLPDLRNNSWSQILPCPEIDRSWIYTPIPKLPDLKQTLIPEMTWFYILSDLSKYLILDIAHFQKMTTSHIWFDPRNDLILDIVVQSQNDLIPFKLSDPRENPTPDIARYLEMALSKILPDLRNDFIPEVTWSYILLNPRNVPWYWFILKINWSQILSDPRNVLFLYIARSQKWPDLRNCRNPDIDGSQKWLTSRYCLITKMS